MTVHRVVGRVEVQHQFPGRLRERGDELLHHHLMNSRSPTDARHAARIGTASRNWPTTRRARTPSEPPDRREDHRGRSDPRTPTPPHARADAPSSAPCGEPSRAGAGHRAPVQLPRSTPAAGRPRATTTLHRWRKSNRRRNLPATDAADTLKMTASRGSILSPSGSWLYPV